MLVALLMLVPLSLMFVGSLMGDDESDGAP
ncbi:hypothetical protein LCGC14_3104870, partial [marine sediment metagenome]